MDCGKSTLALQMDYNHARQGRRGLVLTQQRPVRRAPGHHPDRARPSEAVEVVDDLDLVALVALGTSGSTT